VLFFDNVHMQGPAHDLFRSSVPRLKANILFSVALQDRLKDEKIYVGHLDEISRGLFADFCTFRSTLSIRATSTRRSLADPRLLTVAWLYVLIPRGCLPPLPYRSPRSRDVPHAQGMMQPLWNLFGMTPFEGAKTQLYLAGSPEVEEKNYRCVCEADILRINSCTD
jgi:hypothetical protein